MFIEKEVTMTNKIMVDGIDVNGCIFYMPNYKEDDTKIEYFCLITQKEHSCDKQPCYYKQLKRKEQECEELKKENLKLQKEVNDINVIFMREHIWELKAENDNCKKRLNKLYVFNKKIIDKNFKIACQSTKRKQALDEIEEYCNKCNKQAVMGTANADVVLDIINKAKDGE